MKTPDFLTDNIPYRMFIKDRSFTYTFCNRLYAQDYGLMPEEVIGKDDFAIHPPRIAEKYRKQDEEILTLGEKIEVIEKYYPLGKEGWVRIMKSPYRDENGRIIGILGSFEDVTEEKKAAKERKRLETIIETTDDLISTSTIDEKLTFLNAAGRELLGWGDVELEGKEISEIHPDWAYTIIKQTGIPTAIKKGNWNGETAALHRSGREIPVLQTIMYHKSDDGFPAYLSTIMRDISREKESKKRLRRSKERLTDAQTAGGIGTWEWNIQTGEVIWSENIEPLLGFAPGEFGGTFEAFKKTIHPEDSEAVLEAVNSALEKGKDYDVQHRMLVPDGSTRWIRAKGKAVFNKNGEPERLLGMVQDITDREKLEQELRLKDKAIDSAIVAIAFGTADGTLTYVNRAFLEIWGAESNDRIIGKSALLFWKDLKEAEKVISALYKRGFWSGEMEAQRLDGSVFNAFLSANSITDDHGRTTNLMATFIDITERKKNEAVIREQAEQFNVFKESTQDGFLLVGADSKILDANNAAAKMLDYTVEELKTMSIPNIEAAESEEETAAHIEKMIETGSGMFQSKHRKKNGELIDVEVSTSFWRARNQFFAFIRDITSRKQEERELEQLRKDLATLVDQRTEELKVALKSAEKANRAKTRFLSQMSHELRTPLNVIIGFSQLLETEDESALSTEQKDNVQEILKAGNHLLKLIDTMLEFSAVNENLLNLQIEKVDCGPVISECLETMGPAAAMRNISLDSAVKISCIIQADKNRFRQVLLSLISNAIKYNRENGTVTVSCKSTEGCVRITVTDTGAGIEPEYQDTIFEPFEGTGTRYSVTSGIGIGLAMAKQLVEEMKGNIGVESTIGEGSSFWFDLPYENGACLDEAGE